MKINKFIAILLVVIFAIPTLISLGGCTSGYTIIIKTNSYEEYGANSGMYECDSFHLKDLDDLGNLNVSVASPPGIKCKGYFHNDIMLFDENGDICDVNAVKNILKNSSDHSMMLYMQTELVKFNISLDTVGGSLSFGDEPIEGKVFDNVTIYDVWENPNMYVPLSWKEGQHFVGWKKLNEDGSYSDSTIWWDVRHLADYVTQDTYVSNHRFPWFCYFAPDNDGETVHFKAIYDNDWFRVHAYHPGYDGIWQCEAYWRVDSGANFTEYNDYHPSVAHHSESSVYKWSRSKDEFILFDGVIDEDTEIYYYEVLRKKITLNPMNGDSECIAFVYEGGQTENIPDIDIIKPDGYTFGGWYKTRECDGEAVTMDKFAYDDVENGATYYAKWIKNY